MTEISAANQCINKHINKTKKYVITNNCRIVIGHNCNGITECEICLKF